MSCQRHNDVFLSVDSNLLDPIKVHLSLKRLKLLLFHIVLKKSELWNFENKILIYRMAEKQEEVSRNSEVVTEIPLEDLSPDKIDIKRQSVESDIVKSKDVEVTATPEKKTQSIS